MGKKITAFGEVMMRLEAPNNLKLEQTQTLHTLYTGTGVNVLSALSRYGHHSDLITKLPANVLGDAALSYIRSLGIATSGVQRGSDYLGMYFLEKGFDIRPSKVIYSNRYESSFCTSAIEEYPLEELLAGTDMIHLCGITLAISENTRRNALAVAKMAKQLGVIVVFDFNYRPKLWGNDYTKARVHYKQMLELTDMCFMTERDATCILGMKTDENDRKKQIESLIPRVGHAFNIPTIAGTIRQGPQADGRRTLQGYMYKDGSITYAQPYTFHTLEQIGGGDAFSSGIMHGGLQNLTAQDTVTFATAASALAHTTYGDSPVASEDDVWAFTGTDQYGLQIER